MRGICETIPASVDVNDVNLTVGFGLKQAPDDVRPDEAATACDNDRAQAKGQ